MLCALMNDNSDWVKLNAGQHTLMRVAYTPKMIAALRGAIQSKVRATALLSMRLHNHAVTYHMNTSTE
jgi:hypothetical protein